MPISMSLAANYVTPRRVYSDNIVGKVLTDRRIAFYQKQGRYGTFRPTPKKRQSRRDRTLEELLSTLI